MQILRLLSVESKFAEFLMSFLKPRVSFSLKFASLFSASDITLLYFSIWNFICFGQKKPIKVQNVRLSTAHMKFHQICTFTSYFCWKHVKFQLKELCYRSYLSWHWRVMQNLKQNWFVSKMKRILWILIWALKILKISTLIGSFFAKYVTFDLKKYRGVVFHDTEEWCKSWKNTNLRFGKWHKEYDKFSPEHLKISKLGF